MKFVFTKWLLLGLILPAVICFAEETAKPVTDKKALCAACHGAQGSSSNPLWPNLSGQHREYLIKQLKNLQDPTLRNSAAMNNLALSLSSQEIEDLAGYYAKMPVVSGGKMVKEHSRGEQLYRAGDYEKKITACIACHGPKGSGNALAGFPLLTGQHSEYTIQQLQAFKKGARNNDLNHIMRDISTRLDENDMEAVARYIESLH